MIKLVITAISSSILAVTLGYLIGYNAGWLRGYETGEASILMHRAQKCFLKVATDLLDKDKQH